MSIILIILIKSILYQSMKDGKRSLAPQGDYIFDEKMLQSKQKRLQLFLNSATREGSQKEYDCVKLKGITYSLGDLIELYDMTMKNPYVVKLKRIVKVKDALEKLPFIEVEWCLKKDNLPQPILQKYGKHISVAEIFPSKIMSCLYIESIRGKCTLKTFEEYCQMEATFENVFFSRSDFIDKTGQLKPSPAEWKRMCSCESPINPDLEYVQCGKCEEWFHAFCIKGYKAEETYYCDHCNQDITDSIAD